MSKTHSYFVCQQCGYKSPSYLGKCPECGNWNSFVETAEKETKGSAVGWVNKRSKNSQVADAVKLGTVETKKVGRVTTGISEVDQVLGGSGVVPGSLILLSGDPGIGKSTIMLQILSKVGGLYVTGEESSEQVKLRAERLKLPLDKMLVLPETHVESITDVISTHAKEIQLVIIDSIQTIWSEELTGAPGSVGQVRESTLKLLSIAKQLHIPIILIGHVTKEGTIAGPKVLEHIVDTVLYLEGERFQTLRLLRTTKNRFGPVDEVGVFSLEEKGMMEVANPSELFLGPSFANATAGEAGSSVICTLEGSRPLLVEVQALTVASQIPIPRRVATGINVNRLQMLLAIIQKHTRLPLGGFDVFVNVASGIKIDEPAADLGMCLAIVSSFKGKALPPKTVAIGEVGLLGEIRDVIGVERRIKEAKRLGFKNIISPKEYRSLSAVIRDILP